MSSAENAGRVTVSLDRNIAVICLERVAKRNALSTHMERELLRCLNSEEVSRSRAVLLTGGDSVFSAGADITELREMTPTAIADYYRTTGAVYERVAQLSVPTIAATAGYCLGGGLELALATDFRVADTTTQFGFPEIGIGILPSSGGVARLVRNVGPALTRDLVLRGRRFDAHAAERYGLVAEVLPPGDHLERAMDIALEVAEAPPLAFALTKQVIDAAAESSHQTALLLEQLAYSTLNRND